jgi:hypothetical protein
MQNHLSTPLEKTAKDNIEVVFRLAQDELASLLKRHEQLVDRIAAVKQSLLALSNLFGDELLRKDLMELKVVPLMRSHPKRYAMGLTSVIRRILFESRQPLTTQAVHQQLLRQSPECVTHHKTPLSSIATVLKRLAISGELLESRDSQNVRVWQKRSGEKSMGAHLGS